MVKFTVYIDGINGTGKTTVISELKKDCKYSTIDFRDRSPLTQLTFYYNDDLPHKLSDDLYIILDANVETCRQRIINHCSDNNIPNNDTFQQESDLFMFRYRYHQLAVKYVLHLIDTTNLSIKEVCDSVRIIIEDYLREISFRDK